MNTLTRAETTALLGETTANDLRAHWRTLMASPRRHSLSAAHHLLYTTLLGRDWRRSFTPPTNLTKLANGAFSDWGLFHALHTLHHRRREEALLTPFDGLITRQTLDLLRCLVPYRGAWQHTAAQFTGGGYPFDAYDEKAAEPGHQP